MGYAMLSGWLASGKLAILSDGSWALQDIAKLGFRYGCGVLPKMKEAATAMQAHLHPAPLCPPQRCVSPPTAG